MTFQNDEFQKLFCQVAGDKSNSRRILLSTHGGWIFRMDKVLNRTKKSLEHLKTSVERYNEVFETLFKGVEGQKEIIGQVIHVFGGNDRDKAEKVLQKLCQINCISN